MFVISRRSHCCRRSTSGEYSIVSLTTVTATSQVMSVQDAWEALRVLDEAENWTERNTVLSKRDHAELMQFAQDIVRELVDNLPLSGSEIQYQKVCESEFSDADFNSSFSQFDVDYLENLKTISSSESNAPTRESIYVKFDPLFNKLSPKAPKEEMYIANEEHKRDLMVLDTPLHTMTRCPPSHEASGFSPYSLPTTTSVLKYSDEDLQKLVDLARRRVYQRQKEKMETELQTLRSLIDNARSQVKSHHDNVYVVDSKRSTHLLQMEKLEDERKVLRQKALGRNDEIKQLLSNYQELREGKRSVECYHSVLTNDQIQLENSFDELHGHYVKQKDNNKLLMKWIKEVETYLKQLHEWHKQASEELESLVNAKKAIKNEFKQKCEALQKEYEVKSAVERTKIKKLRMVMKNLQEDLLIVKQDKQQLTQICDDLMKQLELNAEVM